MNFHCALFVLITMGILGRSATGLYFGGPVVSAPSRSTSGGRICLGVPPDLSIPISWLKDNEPNGGWYKPLSNGAVYRHFGLEVGGNTDPNSDDPMCIRGRVDHYTNDTVYWTLPATTSSNLKDYSYTKAICKEASCDFFPSNGQGVPETGVVAYGVKVDPIKKYGIAVFCYPNGDKGWLVDSVSSCVSEGTRREILTWVQKNLKGLTDTSVVAPFDCNQCLDCNR